MKAIIRSVVVISILTGLTIVSLKADNYLSNTDFKDSIAGWRGDVEAA